MRNLNVNLYELNELRPEVQNKFIDGEINFQLKCIYLGRSGILEGEKEVKHLLTSFLNQSYEGLTPQQIYDLKGFPQFKDTVMKDSFLGGWIKQKAIQELSTHDLFGLYHGEYRKIDRDSDLIA